jgi:C1A family cysteine protease
MAKALDLEQLRAELESEGKPFEIRETSMTRLTEDQRVLRLGVAPPPEAPSVQEAARMFEKGEIPPVESATAVGAPPSFDHRNIGGQNYVTPVKDQLSCGSCVAFGSAATVETTARRQRGDPGLAINLSEAHLFYCYAKNEGRNCGNGWWPERALINIRDGGVTYEEFYPYTAGDQSCSLSSSWQNKMAKISGLPLMGSTAQMKEHIANVGPLAACFVVYQDFFSYSSGVYRHVTGGVAGGHCVSIIGYDDAQGCWIAKNSWGTGWGEAGFFKIAYGQCSIESWAGPYGATGVSLSLWQNNKTVRGLWSNNSDRNAWAYINAIGWRKIAADNEAIHNTMLTDLLSAKAGNRPVNYYEQDATIKQVYVL